MNSTLISTLFYLSGIYSNDGQKQSYEEEVCQNMNKIYKLIKEIVKDDLLPTNPIVLQESIHKKIRLHMFAKEIFEEILITHEQACKNLKRDRINVVCQILYLKRQKEIVSNFDHEINMFDFQITEKIVERQYIEVKLKKIKDEIEKLKNSIGKINDDLVDLNEVHYFLNEINKN